jgi:putative membrane protein
MRVRAIPFRAWLLIITLALMSLSFTTTRATLLDVVMHHVGTLLGLGWLVWLDRRSRLSNLSCVLIFCYVMVHMLGAHYLYSNVPYDRWSETVFGTSISEMFGWERNHYDRLVHASFGALGYVPFLEIVRRSLPRSAGAPAWWPPAIAIGIVALVGHLYEIVEWLVGVMFAPETAENYNGQQGDMWDAQKDMAIALAGAIVAWAIVAAAEAASGKRVGGRAGASAIRL